MSTPNVSPFTPEGKDFKSTHKNRSSYLIDEINKIADSEANGHLNMIDQVLKKYADDIEKFEQFLHNSKSYKSEEKKNEVVKAQGRIKKLIGKLKA